MSIKKQVHVMQEITEHAAQVTARLAGPAPITIDQGDPDAALLELINEYNRLEAARVFAYIQLCKALAKRRGARLMVADGKLPTLTDRSGEDLSMLHANTLTVESLGSE
jgi:hypothetical protein